MNTPDLRPCPFCACAMPTSVGIGREGVEQTAIFCPECGAIGPRASSADAPWHAEELWNRRERSRGEDHRALRPTQAADGRAPNPFDTV